MQMQHYRVNLRWIGYGPGNACPPFWKNREHHMLFGFVVKKDGPTEAIEHARCTWHEHEAEVVSVQETDVLGDVLEKGAASG